MHRSAFVCMFIVSVVFVVFMACSRCDTVCVFRLQPSERRKRRNRRKRERKLLLRPKQKQRTSLKSSNQEWANTSTWLPREFTHTSVMMHNC